MVFVIFVGFVSERQSWRLSGQRPQPAQQPATQAQQRPVFRGGTHFVRVDAYPRENGHVVEGLTPGDFEILEDGKPQAIDSFDFIKFDAVTPPATRSEPQSQREGFDMAADPRVRVFVIFVDMVAAGKTDVPNIQRPLVNFIDRIVGPNDLFGLLTSRNSAKDLVLGRRTTVVESQVMDLFRSMNVDRDEADELFLGCMFPDPTIERLKALKRVDASYEALESTVAQLGAIRQERKSIVLVTNAISRARPATSLLEQTASRMPKAGITQGRVGIGTPADAIGGTNDIACTSEAQHLANIDFDQRYRDLMDKARRENVAFYPITPAGLQVGISRANDDLKSLADETDGVAIVDTNDLNAGLKRIADDMAAYYVLGYYTTNTRWDGAIRKITVKAKGKTIRARREYRAPTEAEIAALSAPPAPPAATPASSVSPRDAALMVLERASRPFVPYAAVAGTTLTVVTELSAASIQAGRWKEGADVAVTATGANGEPLATGRGRIDAGSYSVLVPLTLTSAWPARITITLSGSGERPVNDWIKMDPPSGTLVGQAVAWRSGPRAAPRPAAAFEFARNERIRAEWPVLAPLDRREVRLLDRNGKPLPVDLPLSEDPAKNALVVDMSLSGLPRGDYLIELTAGSGATIERRFLAIRIKP